MASTDQVVSGAPGVRVAPPQQMTKFQALRMAGWIQTYDYIVIFLVFGVLVTLAFWSIFGQPTPLNLIACVLIDMFIVQLWVVTLIYRSMDFTLALHADVALMPESAAQIVAGYYEKGGAAKS